MPPPATRRANRRVTPSLAEWAKCLGPDGYFYYSKHPNAPHYIYDKMVGGLVDMAAYAGNKDALKWLSKITGWAEKNLDRSNKYAFGETEWYTLSENFTAPTS